MASVRPWIGRYKLSQPIPNSRRAGLGRPRGVLHQDEYYLPGLSFPPFLPPLAIYLLMLSARWHLALAGREEVQANEGLVETLPRPLAVLSVTPIRFVAGLCVSWRPQTRWIDRRIRPEGFY